MSADLSATEEGTAQSEATGPLAAVRRIAVVPAFNEERNIGSLLGELRALDPDLEDRPPQRLERASFRLLDASQVLVNLFGGHSSNLARRVAWAGADG